jgi:hypothetical protein
VLSVSGTVEVSNLSCYIIPIGRASVCGRSRSGNLSSCFSSRIHGVNVCEHVKKKNRFSDDPLTVVLGLPLLHVYSFTYYTEYRYCNIIIIITIVFFFFSRPLPQHLSHRRFIIIIIIIIIISLSRRFAAK